MFAVIDNGYESERPQCGCLTSKNSLAPFLCRLAVQQAPLLGSPSPVATMRTTDARRNLLPMSPPRVAEIDATVVDPVLHCLYFALRHVRIDVVAEEAGANLRSAAAAPRVVERRGGRTDSSVSEGGSRERKDHSQHGQA